MSEADATPPASLAYGAEDRPPRLTILVLALQHMALALVFLIYPATAAVQMGFGPAQSSFFLAGCIIAGAVGTILQHFRPPIGGGFLGVQIPTPIFLPAIIKAGSVGGLSLISGMVLITALCEIAFSRLLRFVKPIFPPEVCGVAVLMLGVALAKPGFRNFVSYPMGDAAAHLSVAPVLMETAEVTTSPPVNVQLPPVPLNARPANAFAPGEEMVWPGLVDENVTVEVPAVKVA